MAEVVDLGDFRITYQRHNKYDREVCQHKQFELDDNGEVVMCLLCGKQISAFFALRLLTQDWGRIAADIQTRQARVAEEKAKHIHLIAAREVERAWRDRRHVPTCPHCGEGIRATDGFGRGAINLQIDDARRAQRAAAQKDQP